MSHRLLAQGEGRRLRQLGSPLPSSYLDLSPDGKQLALDAQYPSGGDIWLVDIATGRRKRVTLDEASEWTPVWSPDGRRLAYMSYGTEGSPLLQVRQADGEGQPVTLYTSESDTDLWVFSWSPDEDWIAVVESDAAQLDIYALSVEDAGKRVPVAVTSAVETFPQFSPDGRWVAYQSEEGGRSEVFVVSFPDLDTRRQVSTEGGAAPRWSGTGDELLFWRGTTLMASKVPPGDSFTIETPEALFDASDMVETIGYDIAPGGQQLLLSLNNPDARATEIQVVQNWLEELKRLVPVD